MFDSLSDRLNDVFDRLRRRGALTEDDVGAALREIRVALLEADVALPVVRDFIDRGAREGGRPGGVALGDAGPDGRQDRARPSRRDAGRRRAGPRPRRRPRPERDAAGRGHAGRAAGLGQDHDRRQDRAAAEEPRAQEGADGLARRAAAGGAGAIGAARQAGRRRDIADRAGAAAGRDHPAGAASGAQRRL